jgi:hypothetical protein
MSSVRCAARRVVPALVAVILVGCGAEGPSYTGSVSGTVTCGGQPVTTGDVNFSSSKLGVGTRGVLGANGAFTFQDLLPEGEYVVTVTPPLLEPPLPGKTGAVFKKYPLIPQKYRLEATSDLRATVKKGPNTFQFDLVP